MTFRLLLITAVAGLLIGAAPAPANAQPNPPRLRARVVDGTRVRLRWAGVRAAAGSVTVVEITRASAESATAPLASVPARPRYYFDEPATAGVYSYRARVVTDGVPSEWSAAVSAEIEPDPTPLPTPAAGVPGDPPLGPGQRECRAGAIEDTLALINDARRSENASALRDDPDLRWAARTRAIAIATSQQLSHDGMAAAIRASGYHSSVAAENLASGYWSPSAVVQGWLGSSGHHANIVNSAYRDTGIGCVIDQNGKLWWSEEFGG